MALFCQHNLINQNGPVICPCCPALLDLYSFFYKVERKKLFEFGFYFILIFIRLCKNGYLYCVCELHSQKNIDISTNKITMLPKSASEVVIGMRKLLGSSSFLCMRQPTFTAIRNKRLTMIMMSAAIIRRILRIISGVAS